MHSGALRAELWQDNEQCETPDLLILHNICFGESFDGTYASSGNVSCQ